MITKKIYRSLSSKTFSFLMILNFCLVGKFFAQAPTCLPDNWENMEIEAKWESTSATNSSILLDLADGEQWEGYDLNHRWGGDSKTYVDIYYDNINSELSNNLHSLRHRTRDDDWEKVQYKSDPFRYDAVWFREESGACKMGECPDCNIVSDIIAGSCDHASTDKLLEDHPTFDFETSDFLTVQQERKRIELIKNGIAVFEISLDEIDGDPTTYACELELIYTPGLTEEDLDELFHLASLLQSNPNYDLTPSTLSKGGIEVEDNNELDVDDDGTVDICDQCEGFDDACFDAEYIIDTTEDYTRIILGLGGCDDEVTNVTFHFDLNIGEGSYEGNFNNEFDVAVIEFEPGYIFGELYAVVEYANCATFTTHTINFSSITTGDPCSLDNTLNFTYTRSDKTINAQSNLTGPTSSTYTTEWTLRKSGNTVATASGTPASLTSTVYGQHQLCMTVYNQNIEGCSDEICKNILLLQTATINPVCNTIGVRDIDIGIVIGPGPGVPDTMIEASLKNSDEGLHTNWLILREDGKQINLGEKSGVEFPNQGHSFKLVLSTYNEPKSCPATFGFKVNNSDCGITTIREEISIQDNFITERIKLVSKQEVIRWSFYSEGKIDYKKIDSRTYDVTREINKDWSMILTDEKECTSTIKIDDEPIVVLRNLNPENNDKRDGELSIDIIGGEGYNLSWKSNSPVNGKENLTKLSSDWYHLELTDDRNRKTTYNSYFIPRIKGAGLRSFDQSTTNSLLDFEIYPNPNDGNFTLQLDELAESNSNISLEIYNSIGQLVHASELKGRTKTDLSLSGLPSMGIYNVVIRNEDKVQVKKMVISNF